MHHSPGVTVGMIGFGHIGRKVYDLCSSGTIPGITISCIVIHDLYKERNLGPDVFVTDRFEEFLSPNRHIDIVLEVAGDLKERPANYLLNFLLQAMQDGKSIVTANKNLVARHAPELFAQARLSGVRIGFEASVGGGIPIVEPMRARIPVGEVQGIIGILNGTTNYILTRMARGKIDYSTALEEAQSLGFAERDPTMDVSGTDTKYKLAILATLVFGGWVNPDDILCEGIEAVDLPLLEFAKRFAYSVKLIGLARTQSNGEVEAWVHPTLIPQEHPLAAVDDVFNAVVVEGRLSDVQMFYGKGAGPDATAISIATDLIRIASGLGQAPRGQLPELKARSPLIVTSAKENITGGYLKLDSPNQPGNLGRIATILGRFGINIREFHPLDRSVTGDSLPVAFTTDPIQEGILRRAIQALEIDTQTVKPPVQYFRVLTVK